MKLLQYTGRTATIRRISAEDFKGLGIDHDAVEWNVVDIRTRGQAWVSDEVAELLLTREPNNFKEVPEDDRAAALRAEPKKPTSGGGTDK